MALGVFGMKTLKIINYLAQNIESCYMYKIQQYRLKFHMLTAWLMYNLHT